MSYPINFGKYQLLERINVGGMAEVFKAKILGDIGFYSILAVKRILPNMAEDKDFIAMFSDEAKLAVQLKHPGIVQIYEFSQINGQYYIAMEYIPGRDLRSLLDRVRKSRASLPLNAACYIAIQMAEALDYAHRKKDAQGRLLNIIHRDVTPQNILISYEGAVKITDFGIAKAENRSSKTQSGVLKGKFGYMSPEQVRGMKIDHRSDIFACGIILYEMLLGQRLFVGESDFSTLEKIRKAEMPDPRGIRPDLPEALEKIILKALEGDREKRYSSAALLAEDLESYFWSEKIKYTAKDLHQWLATFYAEDIVKEQKKMQQWQEQPATLPVELAPSDNPEPIKEQNTVTKRLTLDVQTVDASEAINDEKTHWFVEGILPPPLPKPKKEDLHVPQEVTLSTAKPAEQVPVEKFQKGQQWLALTQRHWQKYQRFYGLCLLSGALSLVGYFYLWRFLFPNELDVHFLFRPVACNLRIDEQLYGKQSNDVLPLTPGDHVLHCQKAGFETVVANLDIQPGQTTYAFDLKPVVDTNNNAEDYSLFLESQPSGALVSIHGIQQGLTPLKLQNMDNMQSFEVVFSKIGYLPATVVVDFSDGLKEQSRKVQLIALDEDDNETTPQEKGNKTKYQNHLAAPSSCFGTGSFISVMPVKIPNCQVWVGKNLLGITPMFRKLSPLGKCLVEVRCPDGHAFEISKILRPGVEERFIIRPGDWQKTK